MNMGMASAYGAAIRELRGKRTQEECARVAKTAPRSWSRWERGDGIPEAKSLDRIARGLRVEREVLDLAMVRHLQRILAEPRPAGDRAADDAPFVLDSLVRDELYAMADRLWEISGGDRDDLPEPRRLRARRLLRASLLSLVGAFQLLDPAADSPVP